MCAKVSKKTGKSANASNPPAVASRTPQRTTRQTPSKVPPKKRPIASPHNRSTRSNVGNPSDSGSDNNDDDDNDNAENESNDDNQSENDENGSEAESSTDFLGRPDASSAEDELDYLGRPPTHEPSESNTDTNASTQQTPSQPAPRRQSRKQAAPKKSRRRDRVQAEMIKLQGSTKLLIARLPFQRLVREVLQSYKNDFRMQSSTLECLQEAAESYIVQLFEDSYLCCLHRSRVTLTDKDMKLVQILRGPVEPGRP